MNDEQLMQIAIEESRKGDWPYGAVIAKDGEIIVQGHNLTRQNTDPTAHAEIVVIREAAKRLNSKSLRGCTLYTSSESCPMCASAEIWAGVSRVVYGASIAQLISIGQRQIRIVAAQVNLSGYASYELEGGLLADQALQVFADRKLSHPSE